jgi:AcrR family transcriptional regulator
MASRRHTDQGRERKQQLIDEAAVLFASRGYAETRVVDICAAAGAAKGLFYWYFDNKEALFAELVRSMRLRLRQAQAAAMDPLADPLTRLRQGVEASVEFMAAHMSYFALLEVERLDRSFEALMREGTEIHAADTALTIVEAQHLGLIPDGDPTLLALGVIGAVAHFSHFQRSGRITMPVDELATFVGRWVVQALAGEVPVLATP